MSIRKNFPGLGHACLGICLALAVGSVAGEPSVYTESDIDNDAVYGLILGSTAIHNPAFVTSLLGTPPASVIAEFVAFSANIAQKKIPARFEEPADVEYFPDFQGDCLLKFTLPQSRFVFSDLFGLLPVSTVTSGGNFFYGVPTDWGLLGKPSTPGTPGPPSVFHQNSEVMITANHPLITVQEDSQDVFLPAGRHTITWTADTLIDQVFDIYIPGALLGTSIVSYLKAPQQSAAVAGDSARAAKELGIWKKAMQKLAGLDKLTKFKAGLKPVTVGADYLTGTEEIGVTHQRDQIVTVYDVHDPLLSVGTPNMVLEATDFGGVFLNRVEEQITADITTSDPCNRPVSLTHNMPRRLPLGPTTVTWKATDRGPNPQGGKNSVQQTQTITVRDTQAPIMVPPPGRVLEVDPADTDPSDGKDATGIDPAIINLGSPMVVDLADPMPTISSNAPAFFPVNTRTSVTWTATDHGYPRANSSTAGQLITVKRRGTNTAPTVSNRSATTLTSKPVDIVLSGVDRDLIGGRVDPLSFAIESRPAHGEFVAPLYPFFIEDYRTNPAGPYGDAFLLSGNRGNWLYDNICRNNIAITRDWVYHPRFVHVTDDGTVFMIDSYWVCGPSNADNRDRISKWDRDGNYLGQIDYRGTTDAFIMDQDGLIYTLAKTSGGSSTTLTLSQIRPNFDTDPSDPYGDAWRFDFASTPGDPVSNEQYSYARVDSSEGVIYVNDRRRIFAFDVRADLTDGVDTFKNGMDDQYLGALNNAQQVFACTSSASSWTGFAMDVDAQGNLYAADTCGDRILKFEPSSFDASGNFVKGEYVGWMGKCESSTNKACDTATQTSKGFSCTDATCSVTTANRKGDLPGQFATPIYLALDPNSVLYIADYGNHRIQRFADDGTFAGEAQSTGTGINQGTRPNFVLGNMGSPKSVSVNSSKFYVVDVDESFVHVFQTSPFKNITDSSVTVEYVSEFDFHSAADTFTYKATDGLAESNIGTVTVNVNRNFRPPVAFDQEVTTAEDNAVAIKLEGDDPDGILGVDFNGLDTLKFNILTLPAHGRLTGAGENRTYIPDPDYYGTDRFTYRANDGRVNSASAEVVITVTPVDDPPKVMAMELPPRIGRGFPVGLRGGYQDDGAQSHDVSIDWGDVTEVTGDFVDPDGEGGEPPELQGVKLLEPLNLAGEGVALGEHVYSGTGPQTVFYCMQDEQARQHCMSKSVLVESLVNLDVEVTAAPAEIATGTSDVTISVTNMLPEGVPGLTANAVTVRQQANSLLDLTGFVGPAPGCSITNNVVTCAAGSMAPGSTFAITARLRSAAPVIYDEDAIFQVDVGTGSQAIYNNYQGLVSIRIVADTTDSDNDGMTDLFETTYGFNRFSNSDAGRDADGDGLSNLQEFEARTNPRKADTDGDGVRDNIELAAGLDPNNPDSDFDGMRDGWESNNGLDPLHAGDALLDPDNDGSNNLEEFQDGTAINNPDTDGDGRLDGDDPYPTRAFFEPDITPILNLLLE